MTLGSRFPFPAVIGRWDRDEQYTEVSHMSGTVKRSIVLHPSSCSSEACKYS